MWDWVHELPQEAWISLGSALLGSIVGAIAGGLAVVLGARLEASNARSLAREQRIEDAVDEVRAHLVEVTSFGQPSTDIPTYQVFRTEPAVRMRVARLSALARTQDPHLARVVHDYGQEYDTGDPFRDTWERAAALSGALDAWQGDAKKFRSMGWGLKEWRADFRSDAAARASESADGAPDLET